MSQNKFQPMVRLTRMAEDVNSLVSGLVIRVRAGAGAGALAVRPER
jgi:hypothetical protein